MTATYDDYPYRMEVVAKLTVLVQKRSVQLTTGGFALVDVRGWGGPSGRYGRRGCTVWVGGVTADSPGSGQRHRLSAAREGYSKGVCN